MTHGYAYRCDHCSNTNIDESGVVVQPKPPYGWIVVAVAEASIRERVFCSLTCLVGGREILIQDGAWA